MHRPLLAALALAMLLPPVVADPYVLGVPDVSCEQGRLHDYAPPAADVIALPLDGSLGCGLEGDGHEEWAVGGAWLVADDGDGVTHGGPVCWGVAAHHPVGGTVTVTDLSGLPVAFTVTSDTSLFPSAPDEVDCGDGSVDPCDPTPPPSSSLPSPVGGAVDLVNAVLYSLTEGSGAACDPDDHRAYCLGSCAIPFPPGSDGTYTVFIGPTTTRGEGQPTAATGGHVHL